MYKGRSPSYRYEEAQAKRRKGNLFDGKEAVNSLAQFIRNKDIYLSLYKSPNYSLRVYYVSGEEKTMMPARVDFEFSTYNLKEKKFENTNMREGYLGFPNGLDKAPKIESYTEKKISEKYGKKGLIKLWKEWVKLRITGEV